MRLNDEKWGMIGGRSSRRLICMINKAVLGDFLLLGRW